jgi:hypothetical protein
VSRVERVRRINEEKRMAVRFCIRDRLGGYVGGGPRPVFNDEGLAEPL